MNVVVTKYKWCGFFCIIFQFFLQISIMFSVFEYCHIFCGMQNGGGRGATVPWYPFKRGSNQRVKLTLSFIIFEIIAINSFGARNLINVAALYLIWIKSLFHRFLLTLYLNYLPFSHFSVLGPILESWGAYAVNELAGPGITKPLHTTVYTCKYLKLHYSNVTSNNILMKIHQKKF